MDVAVALVDTYLRMNGYLTLTEHPVMRPSPSGFEAATDLDILAARFPGEAEVVVRRAGAPAPGRDEVVQAEDPALDVSTTGVDLIVGEVKEGAQHLNRNLRTPEVLTTALRRAGCCPEAHLPQAVEQLLRRGETTGLIGGAPCRIRLFSFCGRRGEDDASRAIKTITLGHIATVLWDRLRHHAAVYGPAHFKDPVLATLALLAKLGARLEVPE